jgi:serine/threonine-protein phosphatase 4 regulatory subunit 1
LAEIFGTELCEQFVNHEIMSLAEDPSFKVRKAVAEHLVEICKVVAVSTFTNKMFPLYCTLAADTIWGVRKAAADNIVEMAKLTPLEVRLTVLTKILCSLIQDISQWVQRAALQRLGEFIVTLMPSIIPETLVEAYSTMAVANESEEEEVVYQCAYNFPGVLYACSKDQWSKLKGIYFALWELDFHKVTRTLCCSLHEIAKIVGAEVTSSELLPIFLERVEDINDSTIQLLKNAGFILSLATKEQREDFLDKMQGLYEDSGHKWRIREVIANNLFEYCKNYEPITIFKKCWPHILSLCGDDVWCVRNCAAKNAWYFLDYCKEEEFIGLMRSDLVCFAADEKWTTRQVFCIICGEMWRLASTLLEYFLESLVELAGDKAYGVRIAVSNALKELATNNGNCFKVMFSFIKSK